MILRKYIDHVSALQYFQILRFSVLILIGILLVKVGYDKEEIGVYELFFFVSNLFSFFWIMGMKNGMVSYYPSLPGSQQERYFFNLGITIFLLSLVACLTLWVTRNMIVSWLGTEAVLSFFPYIFAYLIFSAASSITEYIYLLKKRDQSLFRYASWVFGLQLFMITIGLFLDVSIMDLFKIMVIWAAMKFVWMLVVLHKHSKWTLDIRMITAFLAFAFPLMLHMLLGNGMEYVDGFLVNHFYDEGTFALFRYGARELPLATILTGALTTAMIPLAVNNLAETLAESKRRISRLMNLLFPISIALMLVSPIIFPLIYNSEYIVSARLFNIYLLIISSRILLPQIVLFAKHSNVWLSISALVELVINVGLSIILLKYFGILGIAAATVIAYAVNKIMIMIIAYRKHSIHPSAYIDWKQYARWLALLVISYYISTLY